MTPYYPTVVELTRQLDLEKIDTLTKRVEDLRNQNQQLKVLTYVDWDRRAFALIISVAYHLLTSSPEP